VNKETRLPSNTVKATGIFKNFNTVEEFKAADKNALLRQVSDEVRAYLCSSLTFTHTHLVDLGLSHQDAVD
jgi:hypothetical protein